MNRVKGFFFGVIFLASLSNGWTQTAKTDSAYQKNVPYTFPPVVVTATKIPQSVKDLSISVEAIPAKEIHLELVHNVGQIIDEVPGVTAIQFGALGSVSQSGPAGSKNLSGPKILIRGTNAVTMIDGRPTMMGIFDHPIGNALNPFLVQSIEIVRGPASVLYGSNATGGVLNFLTPNVLNCRRAHFSLSAGSFHSSNYSLATLWGTPKAGIGIFWSGYANDGNRPNGGYHAHDFFAKAQWAVTTHWQLQASVKRFRGRWLDPGPVNHPLKNNWFDFTRRGADFRLRGKSRLGRTEVLFYRTDGHHAIYDGYLSDDWTNGVKISQTVRPWKGSEWVAGADFRNYGGKDLRSEKSWHVSEWAPYFLAQQIVASKWIASLGYRLNHHDVYGYTSVPSVGLVFQATPALAFRGNLSRGFRSPSVMQLFLYPPSNPHLKPEKTENREVGLHYSVKKFAFDIVAYRLNGTNLIQFYFPTKKFQNVGKFAFKGIETSLRWHPLSGLSDKLVFTHQDVGSVTGYNPQHRFINNLWVHRGPLTALFKTTWVHNLYSENFHRQKLPDFFLLDAFLSLRLQRFLSLRLAARNLTDTSYQMEYGYPMPGRNVEAALQIDWR